MAHARQTEEDLSRIRQLMDAGYHGRPIGGEVLVVLGALLAIVCALSGLTAFSVLPMFVAPSPLAAAAAFLAFAVFAGGGEARRGTAQVVLACLAAGIVGELVWRGVLHVLGTSGANGGRMDDGAFVLATGLLGLVTLAGMFAGAALVLRRLRRDPATQSPANRMVTGGWLAVMAAFAVVLGVGVASGLHSGMWIVLAFLPSLFWTLWGVGWWISAQATGRRWMMLVVGGSWIAALWLAYGVDLYAGTTAGFVALAVLPGLKLLADGRRAADEA